MQQDPEPQAAESDPPIIVQGGGSVLLIVPNKFKEHGNTTKGKGFKNDLGDLASIQINEETPIPLNKTDKITIRYKESS